MSIVRWRPRCGTTLPDLRDEMERLLDWPAFGTGMLDATDRWHPEIDVYEEDGDLVLKADLPGLGKDDIDLELEGDVLTLKGTRKREEEVNEGGFYRCERSYGSFQRSFRLPGEVDSKKVKADFKDGVLEVKLPKAEATKAKKIEVGVN